MVVVVPWCLLWLARSLNPVAWLLHVTHARFRTITCSTYERLLRLCLGLVSYFAVTCEGNLN